MSFTSSTTPDYAELVCTSNFTFLRGASHPQELVARAVEMGYRAIAITDECSLAGVVRGLEEAQRSAEQGRPIQFIPGSSFRLGDGSRLVLLPADQKGYGQLCTLITRGRRNAPKGEYGNDGLDLVHDPEEAGRDENSGKRFHELLEPGEQKPAK